ncbi:MAG: hypothetical protein HRT37_15110 [Alteromonadaceae bacterium]|nr:hypothetical protein [Alteromonadaceae bacterium]
MFNGESYAKKKWGQIQSFAQKIAEAVSWRYNAVIDGLSSDFSDGFVEGMINFTGGRTDMSFGQQVMENYGQSSLVFGHLSVDKTVTSLLVSGQVANRWGGMTIGQWARTGFAPAAHLSTRAATMGYVGYTSVVNSVAITAAYETGNFTGALLRTTANRTFRYFGD